MAKHFWRIRGHKRLENTFFDVMLPVGCLTDGQLNELLKCLAAKEGVSYDEIIGAYVKRKTKRAHDLMMVHKNGPYPEYFCGNDPSFTAMVVDEEGKRIKYPPLP